MKILALALFVTGTFWAYSCLGLLVLPFGAIWDAISQKENYSLGWPYHLLFWLLFLNSLLGYWIWWGWFHYFRKEKFLGGERIRFLSISIANHAFWIFLLPLLFGSIALDGSKSFCAVQAWTEGVTDGWVYLIWPTLIIVICPVFLNEKKRSNTAWDATGDNVSR